MPGPRAFAPNDAWLVVDSSVIPASITLSGEWNIRHAHAIETALARIPALAHKEIVIDAGSLASLDTAGAWLILRMYRDLRVGDATIELRNMKPRFEALLNTVGDLQDPIVLPKKQHNAWLALVEHIGEASVEIVEEALKLVSFIGQTVLALGRAALNPRRLRVTSLIHHMEQTGINAMPIIGLIAFLISIVLAYQGATQLRKFGAEIFTIDLVAVSVLREMAGLLTAIMVAGRSGSSFTAQIGTMQINQEVDALRTMGLDVIDTLVLPRILALILVVPLLTFFADMMGLLGGALMSVALLDVSATQYLGRVQEAISGWTFWIGIIKAPVFAFLIGIVGCLRGLQVSGSAESVGRLTTVSVVESIFLVLIADAMFSILFSTWGI